MGMSAAQERRLSSHLLRNIVLFSELEQGAPWRFIAMTMTTIMIITTRMMTPR